MSLKKEGLLVVAPPGSGKSYWLAHNKNSKWVEGDSIYKGDTTKLTMDKLKKFDEQNRKFKSQGKFILTSIWYDPNLIDYVIIIPIKTIEKNLKGEERVGNDPKKAIDILLKFVNKRKIIRATTFNKAIRDINKQPIDKAPSRLGSGYNRKKPSLFISKKYYSFFWGGKNNRRNKTKRKTRRKRIRRTKKK